MVIVFGSINLDLVARVERIPAPGQTLSATAFAMAPGGKGANQALAARRAGAEVALFGAVGRDTFAAAALANLVAAGVRLDGIMPVDGATGIALINVDDRGENAITVVPGANHLARAAQVPDALLARGNTLLMQLEVPIAEVEALAARAHRAGARVVLNAAPAMHLSPALLCDVDVLIVNEHEASSFAMNWAIPADPMTFFAYAGEQFGLAAVLTLGPRGALTVLDGQPVRAEPARVEVLDTTGAGDALAGALAAALDRGVALQGALAEGVSAGAYACTHHGAQPSS
ncbi:MAG: ribokinase [Casimicrobiaceae bacterium]